MFEPRVSVTTPCPDPVVNKYTSKMEGIRKVGDRLNTSKTPGMWPSDNFVTNVLAKLGSLSSLKNRFIGAEPRLPRQVLILG